MKKKLLWILLGLVIVIVILAMLKKGGMIGQEQGVRVSAEKAVKRDITEIVTASGKVYPEKEVKISPDISGEVVELKVVQEGDSVKKGQELVKINPDIYNAQRDQAAAQVNQQEALVSNIAAQLPGLKAAMDADQKAYDREKQLLDQQVVSKAEFETSESTLRKAQADYAAALQTVKGNTAGVANAKANLDMAAKNLIRTTVVSPIDGVVSLLEIKKGERVVGNSMMAGTEMMRVADMSRIEAIVDVGENDIPKVRLGDTALVEVDAYNNRKFKGIVTEIASNEATSSSTTTSTNDVTNYKVHIRLSPDSYKDLVDPARPKSFPFRPGMSASADIQTTTHVNALSVPINAVTTREKNSDNAVLGSDADAKGTDGSDNANNNKNAGVNNTTKSTTAGEPDEVVYLLEPGDTVKKVKVKTDIQDINFIEIVDGVKEGDQVITGPYSIISKTLKTGTKVKVVPKDKLFDKKEN